MINQKIITNIEEWKNKDLSQFCLKECVNSCCIGWKQIQMNKSQLKEIYGIPKNKPIPLMTTYFGIRNGEELYNVETDKQMRCKGYDTKTKLCKIQHNKPQECKNFPIKIEEDSILLYDSCTISRTKNFVLGKLIGIAKLNNYNLYINFESGKRTCLHQRY